MNIVVKYQRLLPVVFTLEVDVAYDGFDVYVFIIPVSFYLYRYSHKRVICFYYVRKDILLIPCISIFLRQTHHL